MTVERFEERILDRVNASGELYLTHTRLDDRLVLRMSIGQAHTEARHVERARRKIRDCGSGTAKAKVGR